MIASQAEVSSAPNTRVFRWIWLIVWMAAAVITTLQVREVINFYQEKKTLTKVDTFVVETMLSRSSYVRVGRGKATKMFPTSRKKDEKGRKSRFTLITTMKAMQSKIVFDGQINKLMHEKTN